MKNERHNCGGILRNKQVTITKNIGGFNYIFTVKGEQCTKCSEEVISRDTLRKLETLPVKFGHTYRRKQGTIVTLDIPIIHASTVGTIPDSNDLSPTVDTGRVAHAYM